MKQPWEWNKSDLDSLIHNHVQENIGLDYKRCESLSNTDPKKKEISKDVSAFANSAGGIIVYGMIENGHLPDAIDVGFDPSVTSKEWLEQVINSSIQQRIDGIIINPIEISIDKVAYVVYIPQSLRAPHQAIDKKFYKRYNFQSIAMEEYEIRDVSRRNDSPNLKLKFYITVDNDFIHLIPNIINDSPTPAEYVVINIFIDSNLSLSNVPSNTQIQEQMLNVNGQQSSFMHLQINWGSPSHIPIFQGVSFKLFEQPLVIQSLSKGNYIIYWELMSPKMQQKSAKVVLSWDGTSAVISHQ
jgi:hypothetical protein